MERYAIIHSKLPREFVLLQGTGCRWKQCTFCDYHLDISANPFEINKEVLSHVTGIYGTLDIIDSGSAMELDSKTIALIRQIVANKNIHTLWFEAHYMYRNQLSEFAKQFAPAQVKFRCGVETFDPQLRNKWHKGIPHTVTPDNIARHFQGVCLLCCTQGETRQHIIDDISIARQHFEYLSINLFCDNGTTCRRDYRLAQWFEQEIYPAIKDLPGIEILLNNTALGVG